MLGGEQAVLCNLQSAIAGLNAIVGLVHGKQPVIRSVDYKVLCNVCINIIQLFYNEYGGIL